MYTILGRYYAPVLPKLRYVLPTRNVFSPAPRWGWLPEGKPCMQTTCHQPFRQTAPAFFSPRQRYSRRGLTSQAGYPVLDKRKKSDETKNLCSLTLRVFVYGVRAGVGQAPIRPVVPVQEVSEYVWENIPVFLHPSPGITRHLVASGNVASGYKYVAGIWCGYRLFLVHTSISLWRKLPGRGDYTPAYTCKRSGEFFLASLAQPLSKNNFGSGGEEG